MDNVLAKKKNIKFCLGGRGYCDLCYAYAVQTVHMFWAVFIKML